MIKHYVGGVLVAALLFIIGTHDTLARIKLITLPVRERVEIQLDHGEVTLVEEERIVPLLQGFNQVDFSWANTRIDADSIVFRVMDNAGQDNPDDASVRVLSVSYPPGENALVWSVFAAQSGAARVRISYLLGGLDKHFHYRAVAARDEKTLTLSQYLRVNNNANEAFDEAFIWAGVGERLQKPIGLNETKEVLLEKYAGVPVQKTYTSNPAEFDYADRAQNKLNIPMHYVLSNNIANGLGKAALPFGKARIFQRDSQGSIAFIGEDWGKFTPLDDDLKLYLGLARDIVVKRTITDHKRERINGNLYRHEITLKYQIENFKDSAVTLDLAEDIAYVHSETVASDKQPEWRLGPRTTLAAPDADKSDYQRLLFHVDLPARGADGKAPELTYTLQLVFDNEW